MDERCPVCGTRLTPENIVERRDGNEMVCYCGNCNVPLKDNPKENVVINSN